MTTAPAPWSTILPAAPRECRDGEEPCALCRKPVRCTEKTLFVRVVVGGGRFAVPGEVDENGDMGFHPLGTDCARHMRPWLATLHTERGC